MSLMVVTLCPLHVSVNKEGLVGDATSQNKPNCFGVTLSVQPEANIADVTVGIELQAYKINNQV